MSDASPNQSDAQPSRSGRLLALIRTLIDYGRELAATIRQRVASDPVFARTSFGTADLTVIFTRIARGLQLAQALEARVLGRAAALDKGPRPSRARSATTPEPSAFPPAEAIELRLAQLPTAERIAAEVRRRPITAVITDICRDLGILPNHPLWPELQQAVLEFGGNLTRLLCDILDRVAPLPPRSRDPDGAAGSSGLTLHHDAPAGTGPP